VSDPIEEAAEAALSGRLVVLPTDTVYGIGTRPDDPLATAALFDAKGRPRDLSLPVLVPSLASARHVAAFDDRAEGLAGRFWPGPLTLVLPRTHWSQPWDLGEDVTTIAVRLPHDPMALAVLARTGPLAVTSANRSGEPTLTDCDGLSRTFGSAVAVYLCRDDPVSGAPSTLVEVIGQDLRFLRVGAIGEDAIRAALDGPTG
jgi:L-threonylcarbamoyladenylate synthase